MLDPPAAVSFVISLPRVLVTIESHANTIITNSMREELQTALVQVGNCGVVVCRFPEGPALQRRVVAVRFEHGRRMRFHDAIQHEFHRARINPFIMEFLARCLDGLEILGPQRRRIQKIRDVHPQAKVAAMAHFIVKVENLKIASGAVDSDDGVFVGPFHSRAQGQKLFGASGFRNDLGNQVLSSLF